MLDDKVHNLDVAFLGRLVERRSLAHRQIAAVCDEHFDDVAEEAQNDYCLTHGQLTGSHRWLRV